MLGRRKLAPLKCKQIKAGLKKLGFSLRNQEGSHEQWVNPGPPFRKVTVDCPKQPFTDDLIASMAKQAGMGKRAFWEHCTDA